MFDLQCTRSNGRLRRAEEDASSIEKRASETSKELVNAGNQLLNLEVKTKASADKLDLINQVIYDLQLTSVVSKVLIHLMNSDENTSL